jgi:hypothetical protein
MPSPTEDAALIFAIETKQRSVIEQGLGLSMSEARQRVKEIFNSEDEYLAKVDEEIEHLYQLAGGIVTESHVDEAHGDLASTLRDDNFQVGDRTSSIKPLEAEEISNEVDDAFSDWGD